MDSKRKKSGRAGGGGVEGKVNRGGIWRWNKTTKNSSAIAATTNAPSAILTAGNAAAKDVASLAMTGPSIHSGNRKASSPIARVVVEVGRRRIALTGDVVTFPLLYRWRKYRPEWYAKRCRLIARGKMNSALVDSGLSLC